MVTQKIAELNAERAKIDDLEKSIAAELTQELAALPRNYGFATVAAFVSAVRAAARSKPGRKAGKAKVAAPGKKRRTRAKITDATREELKKLVASGKTGAEISKALGISMPSVQNIKKALGLVKKRA